MTWPGLQEDAGVTDEIVVTSPWRDLCCGSRRLWDAGAFGQHPVELVS
jgi:hypothetical protein